MGDGSRFYVDKSQQSKIAAKNQTHDKNTADASKIHSLYRDLYLTDLKNDISDVEDSLMKEKERYAIKSKNFDKLKYELDAAKKTIQNYRRMLIDQQKEFASTSLRGAPSAITMTSFEQQTDKRSHYDTQQT